MRRLQTRQRIVDFMRDFIERKGYAPTIGEIQRTLGLSSKSLVAYHLDALEEEGVIQREPETARGIDIYGVGHRARSVPLAGPIAAGQPIPVPTEDTWHMVPEEMVEVPADMIPMNVRAFALRVQGKSMVDAYVDDGDIVILEATPAAETGQMVAAWLTDRQEATLKKIYYEQNRIRLQPANQRMKPIYVNPDDIEIQGRVIAVLRRLKQ